MAGQGKSGSIDVTEGVIWRQLLSLCIPIFFASFFQQAYNLVNTFIVGQFGGKIALGGIQSTSALSELAIGFCVGLVRVAPSSRGSSSASAMTSALRAPCIPP